MTIWLMFLQPFTQCKADTIVIKHSLSGNQDQIKVQALGNFRQGH